MRHSPARAIAAATSAGIVLAVCTVTEVGAQAARVNFDAGAAHARPPAGSSAEASSYLLLGGRFVAGPAFGTIHGGLAANLDAGDWASGVLGVRLEAAAARRIGVALTTAVSAFTLGEPTPYRAATATVVPELRLLAGGSELALRGSAGIGSSEVTDRSVSPSSSVVTDLWLYGGGAEWSRRLGRARIRTGAEAYRAASGTYSAAYAGWAGPLAGARWAAELRVWDTPGDAELQLDLSLTIPLRGGWSLELSGGRSAPDPLLGSPPGIGGSAVASKSLLASRAAATALYTLAGGEPAVVVFRLSRPEARAVSVIGDFSNWSPIPLRRRGRSWVARVTVPPGVYHFGFLVDGEWYVPDDAPGRVTDEFGRSNATLVVPSR